MRCRFICSHAPCSNAFQNTINRTRVNYEFNLKQTFFNTLPILPNCGSTGRTRTSTIGLTGRDAAITSPWNNSYKPLAIDFCKTFCSSTNCGRRGGIEPPIFALFERCSTLELNDDGATGRTRTLNLPVRSRELSPLSYRGVYSALFIHALSRAPLLLRNPRASRSSWQGVEDSNS